MTNVIKAGKTFRDNVVRIKDAMITNSTLAEQYIFPDLLGMSEAEINADFNNLSTIKEMAKNFTVLFLSSRIFLMKQPTLCSVLSMCNNTEESEPYGYGYAYDSGYDYGYEDYYDTDYTVDITWDIADTFYYYGYSAEDSTSWDFSIYNSTYQELVGDLSVVDKYREIITTLFNNNTQNASLYESHTHCLSQLTNIKEDILKVCTRWYLLAPFQKTKRKLW